MPLIYEWSCDLHGFQESVYDHGTGPAPVIGQRPCRWVSFSNGERCGRILTPSVRSLADKATDEA